MLFLIFVAVWAALCFILWRLVSAQLALLKAREERGLRAIIWRN